MKIHWLGCLLLTCICLAATAGALADDQSSPGERPGESYLPGDALGDVAAARAKALEEDRLLLVVMGANWCHDSRALAARLEENPLRQVIDDHYEMVFVDVGYLDKGKDVITSLGVPVWYATPTVLIVDPVSGELVNAGNRHQWGSAAKISMTDTVDYFQSMAETDLDAFRVQADKPAELARLLAEIDAFEQVQASRVYAAYARLSPMLAAYDSGNRDGWSEKAWNEVGRYRKQVARDLDALRLDAARRVAAGETGITLEYPQYRAFSWE